MKIEIIAQSIQDALNAKKAGADRIELLTSLYLGGLSTTPATVRKIKEKCDINIASMVRVRGGGFCYSNLEKEVMFEEAKDLCKAGSDGIVFGFLDKDANIDEEATRKMVEIIHSYRKEAVFHRAIDCVFDIDKSVEILIKLKVDRVLTSGRMGKALKGYEEIAHLQKKYGSKIQILAGSGITHENVKELVEKTKVKQIHTSCKGYLEDTTSNKNFVSFDYDGKNLYDVNDIEKIKKIVNELRK